MRWASLTPETTQWIYALGRGSALVARSHLCQEPPEVERLPSCTRPGAVPPGWEKYVAPYAPDFWRAFHPKSGRRADDFPCGGA
ncbi:MAG: hypothetical protein KatS3mg026_1588 [Bacteroidia bacterium]|nr:MAG: hypothetical protein KatS3mg026_1588 [Bacteroidia bacterium]